MLKKGLSFFARCNHQLTRCRMQCWILTISVQEYLLQRQTQNHISNDKFYVLEKIVIYHNIKQCFWCCSFNFFHLACFMEEFPSLFSHCWIQNLPMSNWWNFIAMLNSQIYPSKLCKSFLHKSLIWLTLQFIHESLEQFRLHTLNISISNGWRWFQRFSKMISCVLCCFRKHPAELEGLPARDYIHFT